MTRGRPYPTIKVNLFGGAPDVCVVDGVWESLLDAGFRHEAFWLRFETQRLDHDST